MNLRAHDKNSVTNADRCDGRGDRHPPPKESFDEPLRASVCPVLPQLARTVNATGRKGRRRFANPGTASVIFTGVVTKNLETARAAPTGARGRHTISTNANPTDARKELQYLAFCSEH